MDLFNELARDSLVGDVRIALGSDTHRRVFEDGDVGTQVTNQLRGQLAFFSNCGGEFTGIILNVLCGC